MPQLVDTDPRPPLAFRVGVTGSRHLDAAAIGALRGPVGAVLLRVHETAERAASERAAAALYRSGPGTDPSPKIRLLSPLAEGADRLVAEGALKPGCTLCAPLPFAQPEYEKDFQAIARVREDARGLTAWMVSRRLPVDDQAQLPQQG